MNNSQKMSSLKRKRVDGEGRLPVSVNVGGSDNKKWEDPAYVAREGLSEPDLEKFSNYSPAMQLSLISFFARHLPELDDPSRQRNLALALKYFAMKARKPPYETDAVDFQFSVTSAVDSLAKALDTPDLDGQAKNSVSTTLTLTASKIPDSEKYGAFSSLASMVEEQKPGKVARMSIGHAMITLSEKPHTESDSMNFIHLISHLTTRGLLDGQIQRSLASNALKHAQSLAPVNSETTLMSWADSGLSPDPEMFLIANRLNI